MKTRHWIIILAALMGVAFGAVSAWSPLTEAGGEQDSRARVVPYDGYLSQAGVPFTGSLPVVVALLRSSAGSTSFVYEDVEVKQGIFKINLGGGQESSRFDFGSSSIPDAFWTADEQTITLGVFPEEARSDSGGGFLDDTYEDGFHGWFGAADGDMDTAAQPIKATPFAYWSATSGDFHADGNVDLAGLTADALVVDTDSSMTANVLSARGGMNLGSLEIQDVGSIGASLSPTTSSGNDLSVELDSGAAGIRMIVDDETKVTVTGSKILIDGDLTIASGSTIHIDDELTTVRKEPEVTAESENGTSSPSFYLGEYNSRRFCVLTTMKTTRKNNGNRNEKCQISVSDGAFYLTAFQGGSNSPAPVTCIAQCITW